MSSTEGEEQSDAEVRGGAAAGFDINITDSQVMIQLKEAEAEAGALRAEIKQLREEIEDYERREELTEEDSEVLQEKQLLLMEKLALLDELTKRIGKLMEFEARGSTAQTTILSDDEDKGLPDDLLPRVVICSSWDDLMPKVVVCMDLKKPGGKRLGGERDEFGLTPEQAEALEKERRCMAEERGRLQRQIGGLEEEVRTMMRENDMLNQKIGDLKNEIENQPPFEFEMTVSGTQQPGAGEGGAGPGTMAGVVAPGSNFQGAMTVPPPGLQYPSPGDPGPRYMPCGGPQGIPKQAIPCPKMAPPGGMQGAPVASSPPPRGAPAMPSASAGGKKCRKEFNAAHAEHGCPCKSGQPGAGFAQMPTDLPPGIQAIRNPPQLNFKVNVQPHTNDLNAADNADENYIANQLKDIEMQVKMLQKQLNQGRA